MEKIRPVREVLRELKDLSSFAIDLAYSSLLTGDVELAEKVLEIEEDIGELYRELQLGVLMAADDLESAKSLIPLLSVAYSAREIGEASADIAKLVLSKTIPPAGELLEKTAERLFCVVIKDDSPLVGKNLGELDWGANVIAVKRQRRWFLGPEDDFVLREGDCLIVEAPRTEEVKVKELAKGEFV